MTSEININKFSIETSLWVEPQVKLIPRLFPLCLSVCLLVSVCMLQSSQNANHERLHNIHLMLLLLSILFFSSSVHCTLPKSFRKNSIFFQFRFLIQ